MKPAPVLENLKPRLALAAIAALAAMACWAVLADAAGATTSGGIGSAGTSTTTGTTSTNSGDTTLRTGGATYSRLWDRVSLRDRRWARQTSECESDGDPRAISGGGLYRGAFQFMRSTWRHSPKSPGGDPIIYTYRTQAVVAILLMHRDGTQHWPGCG
jgi:hypothetical protein